ncbi:MAG: hypothetical protein HOM47_04915 [Euryarchaeota archaeon]|nr:hypothetical protein [Euryarchaeota archaeon]MBT5184494.1 hypothetical protein [Euryarchaeota archaeon]
MEEKVGFNRALSASIVLGLYSGFMLAVAIAMSVRVDGIRLAAFLWGLTIVLCALFLTPILAAGRKRGRPENDADVTNVRLALEEFNEGIGGWRALSHIRGEGMGVSISLSNSSNPLLIIEKALQVAEKCKLVFRFPKNDTSLRDRTLPILEEKVGTSRIQRRTKSLTVVPKVVLDRSVIITRSMMLCPPLMAAGAMGLYSVAPEQPMLAFVGAVAGLVLGMLVVTNKGR